ADGVTVIARVDDTSSLGAACNPHFSCFLQARLPAAESQLYLRFEGPAAPEANDHYVAIVELFSGGYDVEPASDELEDVNDTAASALALDVVGTEPGLVRYVLWGGMHAGDEDWWIVGGDAADA